MNLDEALGEAVHSREILSLLHRLDGRLEALEASQTLPAFMTLRRACELAGLSYNTIKVRKDLQPNRGKADAMIGGRRYWKRETFLGWIRGLGG